MSSAEDRMEQIQSLKDWASLPQGKDQFPLEYIKETGALILERTDHGLVVGISKNNSLIRRQLKQHQSCQILSFIPIDPRELSIFLADQLSVQETGTSSQQAENLDLQQLEGDAPMINLVNSLIMEALKHNASDIHIVAYPKEIQARYRIDGVLKTLRTIPREHFSGLSSRIKIMANLNIMERRLPQDGRISVKMDRQEVDLRVSILPIAGQGESIVLRLLNRNQGQMNLEEMGFSPRLIESMENLIRHPHGLILITGPTGSGKTTTLNALLKELRNEEWKIITIEDPIEFVMDGIEQVQTNGDIGLGFSTLLRRVLRQDPNIIMVGEIRDGETAELAIRAALTGHLVLSTLHTNDSLSVIPRLINMGVEPYLLAAVLKGAQAQRLVRKLCPECREKALLEASLQRLWKQRDMEAPESIYRARGCEACQGQGYQGRTAIGEIFLVDKELEERISRGDSASELARFMEERMTKLHDQGLELVSRGITSLEELEGALYL